MTSPVLMGLRTLGMPDPTGLLIPRSEVRSLHGPLQKRWKRALFTDALTEVPPLAGTGRVPKPPAVTPGRLVLASAVSLQSRPRRFFKREDTSCGQQHRVASLLQVWLPDTIGLPMREVAKRHERSLSAEVRYALRRHLEATEADEGGSARHE